MARPVINVVVVVIISLLLSVLADGAATALYGSGRNLSSEDVLKMKIFPVQTLKPATTTVGSNDTADSSKNVCYKQELSVAS